MSGGSIELRAGDHVLTIDPAAGARIESWTVAGQELLVTAGPDPVEYGMYPMAPWAGRLRGNVVRFLDRSSALPATYGEWALHGTVLAAAASRVAVDESAGTARLVAAFDSHPAWPWGMSVEVDYSLDTQGLTSTIRVSSDEDLFPVVVGWHPWFRRRLEGSDDLVWSIEADGMLERGDDHLPTGAIVPIDQARGPFDDAFRVPTGVARVAWPGALAIDISGDANWFVLYDKPEASVCVEPQSGPPDGLRSSLDYRLVSPEDPFTWTTRWQVRDDLPADPA